jgi:esterase/lipase
MEAIARRFHQLGFNVVLPLLPAHGLQSPGPAFRKLKHTDWIKDVDRVMALTSGLGETVSLGGFSTGGALTVEKVIRSPEQITGGLFLFSAALDIGKSNQFLLQSETGRMIGRLRDDKIWLGKSAKEQFDMILADQKAGEDDNRYGIGDNPYKYSVFFYEGASQLANLIEEIDDHYTTHDKKYDDISQPVFVAHSKSDQSALFSGAEQFYKNHPNNDRECFWITNLPHASVVLEKAIIDDEDHPQYSPKNPEFDAMMEKMVTFTRQHLLADE